MLFTSISFLYYFLPITLILYFIVPKKYKNVILLVSSLLFYFYGEPIYVFLMIAEILIAYFGALLIDKHKDKTILIILLMIHISLLFIFKYTDFILTNINNIFNANINLLKLALPIGISFYTFQIISYEVDVYKKKVSVQKNIINLATYVSLFPQLIAGPIVRYESINQELDNRKTTFNDFSYGVRRFIIGLSKKVLLANVLGELCSTFNTISDKTVVFYWLFAISYMLQIYLDFSAYSDMAIGLGRMFGFHFLENFNYPYISKSITEFWRRWHMSLSSWFKDYVYIPLGGSRCEKTKIIRNIFVVWFLTGLWHGASWNFIIWGLLFGIVLVIEKLFLQKVLDKTPNIFKHIYVLFIVMISFVIFNGENIINNIQGLFGINNISFINSVSIHYLKNYLIILIISILACTPLFKNIIEKLKNNKKINKVINILEPIYLVLLLFIVTVYLINNSYNPFLYFRF